MHKPHTKNNRLGCMSKLDKWKMEDKVVTVKANRLRVHHNADIIVLLMLLSCRYYCLAFNDNIEYRPIPTARAHNSFVNIKHFYCWGQTYQVKPYSINLECGKKLLGINSPTRFFLKGQYFHPSICW